MGSGSIRSVKDNDRVTCTHSLLGSEVGALKGFPLGHFQVWNSGSHQHHLKVGSQYVTQLCNVAWHKKERHLQPFVNTCTASHRASLYCATLCCASWIESRSITATQHDVTGVLRPIKLQIALTRLSQCSTSCLRP